MKLLPEAMQTDPHGAITFWARDCIRTKVTDLIQFARCRTAEHLRRKANRRVRRHVLELEGLGLLDAVADLYRKAGERPAKKLLILACYPSFQGSGQWPHSIGE